MGNYVPEMVVSNMGIFPPFLFTSDFSYNSDTRHLQKFSGDSAIVRSNSRQLEAIIPGLGVQLYWVVHTEPSAGEYRQDEGACCGLPQD